MCVENGKFGISIKNLKCPSRHTNTRIDVGCFIKPHVKKIPCGPPILPSHYHSKCEDIHIAVPCCCAWHSIRVLNLYLQVFLSGFSNPSVRETLDPRLDKWMYIFQASIDQMISKPQRDLVQQFCHLYPMFLVIEEICNDKCDPEKRPSYPIVLIRPWPSEL